MYEREVLGKPLLNEMPLPGDREGKADMKTLKAIALFLSVMIMAGCNMSGTIYQLAADERDVDAIVIDKKIATVIQKSFVEDPEINALDISVYCYNGDVYLVGECERDMQKDRAVRIAKDAEGVKSVEARIFTKIKDDSCGLKENLIIKGKLNTLLIADMDVWSTTVDVKVVQCKIVLLGIVESKEEIDRAVAHARGVEGNRGVISYLKSTEK